MRKQFDISSWVPILSFTQGEKQKKSLPCLVRLMSAVLGSFLFLGGMFLVLAMIRARSVQAAPSGRPLMDTETNIGVVEDKDQGEDDITFTAASSRVVAAAEPVLVIEKTCSMTTARIGDRLVYTFRVRNDGGPSDGPVYEVTVTDSLIDEAAISFVNGDDGDGWLERDEIWTYTAPYTIDFSDTVGLNIDEPLVNTALVSGFDKEDDLITDTTTHTLDIEYTPALTIHKTGPTITAEVDDNVVYTFTISHIDNLEAGDGTPVTNVIVHDSVAGLAQYESGDDDDDGWLEQGETWTYTISYTIQPTDAPSPLVNTGTVSGTDKDGDTITATATHNLSIDFAPVINLEEPLCPSPVQPDNPVNCLLEVDHAPTSDGSPIMNIIIADAEYVGGETPPENNKLDAGEIWVYRKTYTIPLTAIDVYTISEEVEGEDGDGDVSTDTETIEFIIAPPPFSVTIDGPEVGYNYPRKLDHELRWI